jgi:hypothetical protein
MTLIRRLALNIALRSDLMRLVRDQQKLIADQTRELRRAQLEHMREVQGLVSGWLIAIERPEVDMRPELVELERMLGTQIAVLEEHVV